MIRVIFGEERSELAFRNKTWGGGFPWIRRKTLKKIFFSIMGQKVNPLCFRLGVTQRHNSQWFAKKTTYSELVMEDHFLRKLITSTEQFSKAGIRSISIERRGEKLDIEMVVAQPRVLTLSRGHNLEKWREEWSEKIVRRREQAKRLNSELSRSATFGEAGVVDLSLKVVKVKNPNAWAPSIAASLVNQLEERIPFRRAMKSVLRRARVTHGEVKGIKIQVSGRLNGAEIARTEWLREGRVPLQTLRARVDYSHTTAQTKYGLLGIKVWVFKGLAEKRNRSGIEESRKDSTM
jgi:small subunit ribosomal protein S3